MYSQLYCNFSQAKQGNSTAIEIISQYFLPQIRKYSRLLDGEDTRQDLLVFLIELIRKMPIERDCFQEDNVLLAYTSKSLKNKYFELSKKRTKIKAAEVELTPDFALLDPQKFENSILLLDLLQILKPQERQILIWIYFYGYSVKEIAEILHISKQAVNQIKLRTLKKLRNF